MRFNVIVADPPWGFSDKLTMSDVKRGSEANYNGVLSIDKIKSLDIHSVSQDDAVLALWVPSSLLPEGLDVMKAWGFELKQTHIWVKTKKNPFDKIKDDIKKLIKSSNSIKSFFSSIIEYIDLIDFNDFLGFFMGRLFRNVHEICLLGVKGKHIYKQLKNKSQRSVHFAPNLEHSAKPPILQDRLELMFPDAKKLELFARRPKDGWVCVGNELVSTNPNDSPFGEDIFDSIRRLKDL